MAENEKVRLKNKSTPQKPNVIMIKNIYKRSRGKLNR